MFGVFKVVEADGALFSFCHLPQVLVIEQKNEDGTWPRGSTAPKWVNDMAPCLYFFDSSCTTVMESDSYFIFERCCRFTRRRTEAVYYCMPDDLYVV